MLEAYIIIWVQFNESTTSLSGKHYFLVLQVHFTLEYLWKVDLFQYFSSKTEIDK